MQEDWIELQTRKYGTVLFNKQTGEIAASPVTAGQGEGMPTSATVTATLEKPQHDHDAITQQEVGDDEDGVSQTPQPALRKRKVLA